MAGYDAFISYSHAADGNLALALQSGLQRLAKQWQKRRALEVFRDRTGLAVTPHLWSEISVALGQSRWLVLLASPDSAGSKWVNQEIEFFLAQDPTARDRILPVVTGGVWQWAGEGAFTADSSSVPAALHGVFIDEPLYLDLRWAKDRTDLSLHDAVFRAAVADVAAPIHGKSKDELVGEDVHQFRLARRVRRAAVISLAVLTIGALVASVVAVTKSREAVRQRIFAEGETRRAEAETKRANDQTEIARNQTEIARDQTAKAVANADDARSRELAASAVGLTADDPAVAALLAVESLYPNDVKVARETPESINAIGVTSRALLSRIFVSAGSLPDATGQAIVATVGDYVATIGPENPWDCWPVFENGAPVAAPITWWNKATEDRSPGVPPDVQLATEFINTDWGVMRIDDELTVTPVVGTYSCDAVAPTYTAPVVYDDDSNLIVAFETAANQFVTLDPTTLVVQSRMTPLADPSLTWTDVTAASDVVIASKSDGSLRVWGVKDGGPGRDFPLGTGAGTLATSGGVVFGGEGLVDLNRDAATSSLPDVFPTVSFALFSADTRFLALIDGRCRCRAGIWDVSNPSTPTLVSTIASTTVSSLRWLDHTLGLTSARGVEFYEFIEPKVNRNALVVSADGSTWVSWPSVDGQLGVHGTTDADGTPGDSIGEAPQGAFRRRSAPMGVSLNSLLGSYCCQPGTVHCRCTQRL